MRTNVVARHDSTIYERRWRGLGRVNGSMTMDAMIETLVDVAEELRTLAAAGVCIERVTGYDAILITRDEAVAKRYGFWPREDDPGVSVSDRDRASQGAVEAQGAGDRPWRAHVTCARP